MSDKSNTVTREAGEHINNIQIGLHADEVNQTCSKMHGDLSRAMIWAIRRIEEIFYSTLFEEKECKVVKFWGIELPMERGLSFRDLIVLVIIGYVVYVHIKTGGLL